MMSNNPLPSTRVLGPSKPPDFSKPDSAIPQCSTEQCNDDELGNLLGVITAGPERVKLNAKRAAERAKIEAFSRPGAHPRELNPYWRDGGTGLPPERESAIEASAPSSSSGAASSSVVGDAGYEWLRRAYDRCVQQSQESGRSLEEIAAERWGSLSSLLEMLQRAEKERSVQRASPVAGWSRRQPSPGRTRSTGGSNREARPPAKHDERREHDASREHHSSHHTRAHGARAESERSARARRESPDATLSHSESNSRHRRPERTASSSSSSSEEAASSRPTYRKPAGPSKPPTSHAYTPQFPLPSSTQIARSQQSAQDAPTAQRLSSTSIKEAASPAISSDPPPSSQLLTGVSKAPISLSAGELNKLAARVLRAELAGNGSLAKQLQAQLEAARSASANSLEESASSSRTGGEKRAECTQEVVLLTTRDTHGFEQPLRSAPSAAAASSEGAADASRNEAVSTRAERFQTLQRELRGELRELAEAERKRTANDVDLQFANMSAKRTRPAAASTELGADEEYDAHSLDRFQAAGSDSNTTTTTKTMARASERAKLLSIQDHKQMKEAREKCSLCLDKALKHLIVAMGQKCYVRVPAAGEVTLSPLHCQIVPLEHCSNTRSLDDSAFEEIESFKEALARMFARGVSDPVTSESGSTERPASVPRRSCVFLETALHFKRYPHTRIDCIPLDGDMALTTLPATFKLEINRLGSEWAQNKKLVELRGGDVRRSVPHGFPYFAVWFTGASSGSEGGSDALETPFGYAHIIDDEREFSEKFGLDTMAGVLELDPNETRTHVARPSTSQSGPHRRRQVDFSGEAQIFERVRHLQSAFTPFSPSSN